MAEQLDPKELTSFKELLMSEIIHSEALVNLLDRKGIISKQELPEEMRRVQATMVNNALMNLYDQRS
jgi:hypothetical protein